MTTSTMATHSTATLIRDGADRWITSDGRFRVTRQTGGREVGVHFLVTDTTQTDWVDRPGHGNTVRVFALEDARALIARAIRRTPRRRS